MTAVSPLAFSIRSALNVYSDANGNLVTVTAASPLPVSATFSPSGTQDVNLAQVAGATIITGGVTGSQAIGGPTASGASFAANPLPGGGRAQNAEATAVTNGQAVATAHDLYGRQIILPYANKENWIGGSVAQSGTTAGTLVAAAGASVKLYATSILVGNIGSNDSAIQLNDTLSTVIPAKGSSGGAALTFPVPLEWASNTAITATPLVASGTIYTSLRGFKGA